MFWGGNIKKTIANWTNKETPASYPTSPPREGISFSGERHPADVCSPCSSPQLWLTHTLNTGVRRETAYLRLMANAKIISYSTGISESLVLRK